MYVEASECSGIIYRNFWLPGPYPLWIHPWRQNWEYSNVQWHPVRRKRPEKWRIYSWFLLQDNAPAYRPLLAKDFLAKSDVTTLENPPYSSDLAAGDFYLFPKLKSTLKGGAFVMLLTSLRMRRKSWKGFYKMTS